MDLNGKSILVTGGTGSLGQHFVRTVLARWAKVHRLVFSRDEQKRFQMAIRALLEAKGGEIFVPKISSYRIMDLAEAISPDCTKKIAGIPPREKTREAMINPADSPNAVERQNDSAILPSADQNLADACKQEFDARPVEAGFGYSSGDNVIFFDIEAIRQLVRQHLDPDFSV